tara:strand:+ start:344 stop:1216 length:873 start_codon:yes stop_codon:yes gene_type:complete
MGYSYPGFGLRTKIDFSRQVYQNCDTTAEMSGSSRLQQTVLINKSGTSSTYNFNFTSTSANTAVFSMGIDPDLTFGKSAIQINSDLIPTGTGVDLEIDTSTNEVFRVASSLKYKKDIEPLNLKELNSILELTPVRFKWKNNEKSSVGLIAEEVDSVGLKDFVIYNENNEPDGINYKLLTIALIGVLKQGKIPVVEKTSEVKENIPVNIKTNYTTLNTRYIIATEDLTITLNDTNLNRFYIKSMANITVKTKSGKIDGEWEEISMGPQSSIEVLSDNTNWFILSSDGLKNS